ncbi:Uncharacterized protein At5g23160 [Linum grandiflorum]
MDSHTNNPNLPSKPNKPPSPMAVFFSGRCFRRNSVASVPAGHHQRRPIGSKKKKRWFPMMKNPPSLTTAATKTFPLIDSSSPPRPEEANGEKQRHHKKLSDYNYFPTKSKFNRWWKTNCIVRSGKRQRPPPAAADTLDQTLFSASTAAGSFDGAIYPKENNAVPRNVGVSEDGGDVEEVAKKVVVTCKKRLSFCRKIDDKAKTTSGSCSRTHPGYPVRRTAQNDSVLTTPGLQQIRPLTIAVPAGKLESSAVVVGMSIIAVALGIVVVWGRLCAVVCTAGWLYFVPRLRTVFLSGAEGNANRDENSGGGGGGVASVKLDGDWSPELDSAEYKRRVVLGGFLQRNRRPS